MPRFTTWPGAGRNALLLLAFLIFFAQMFHAGNDLLVGRHEDPATSPPGFGLLGSLAVVMIIGFGALIGLVVGLGEQAEGRRAGISAVWRALVDLRSLGPPSLQSAVAALPRTLPPAPRARFFTVGEIAGGIWIAGLLLDTVELYLLGRGTVSFFGAVQGAFEGGWLLLRILEAPYALFWGVVLGRYEARQLGRERQATAAASALEASSVAVAVVRRGTLRYASPALERLLGSRGISGEPAELGGEVKEFAVEAERLEREQAPDPLTGALRVRIPKRGAEVQREGIAARLIFDGLPSTVLIFAPS